MAILAAPVSAFVQTGANHVRCTVQGTDATKAVKETWQTRPYFSGTCADANVPWAGRLLVGLGLGAAVAFSQAHRQKRVARAAESHSLNLYRFLVKGSEQLSLHEVTSQEVSALCGLDALGTEALNHRKVHTISELANWKYYRICRGLITLESVKEKSRNERAEMNINRALDKEWETKPLAEVLEAPLSALQGLTPADDELFAKLQIKTIRQLGTWKFAQWARAICDFAEFENLEW